MISRTKFKDDQDLSRTSEMDGETLTRVAEVRPDATTDIGALGRLAGDVVLLRGTVRVTVARLETLRVELDGAALKGPILVIKSPLKGGAVHVIVVGRAPLRDAAGNEDERHLRVLDTEGGVLLAASWSNDADLPALDAADLLAQAAPGDRIRIVRQVLEMVGPWFKVAENPVFAGFCRRLVQAAQPRLASMARAIALTPALTYCRGQSGRLSDQPVCVIVLDDRAIRRSPLRPRRLGRSLAGQGVEFELVVDSGTAEAAKAPAAESSTVIVFDQTGMAAYALPAKARENRSALLPMLEALGVGAAIETRHYLLTGLKPYLGADEGLRALLGEVMALITEPPRQIAPKGRPIGAGIDRVVVAPDGGLFVKGWTFDPHGMIKGLTAISPFGTRLPVALDGFRHRRPELESSCAANRHWQPGLKLGFLACQPGPRDPLIGAEYRFEFLLTSGAVLNCVSPPPPPTPRRACLDILGSLGPDEVTDDGLATVIAPIVAPLHQAHLAQARVRRRKDYGTLPARVRWSVIVPLYQNLDFLRAQLAALALDPDSAELELIYVLDSPEQEDDLDRRLGELHFLYGLPFRLVVHERNFGYAVAVNSGAGEARGAVLVLLNSDVVPVRPGWLPALSEAVEGDAAIGVAGPKLLFEDDSLQHAGMYFGCSDRGKWFNRHFFKGYPRDYPPANIARAVPAVTGACLLIKRDLFERIGGITEDYIIGDYEDSDLCLKVRSAGQGCWYAPSVELYHFERQSIQQHDGYMKTLASEYNQWLHGCRWDHLIPEVMASRNGWGL